MGHLQHNLKQKSVSGCPLAWIRERKLWAGTRT